MSCMQQNRPTFDIYDLDSRLVYLTLQTKHCQQRTRGQDERWREPKSLISGKVGVLILRHTSDGQPCS